MNEFTPVRDGFHWIRANAKKPLKLLGAAAAIAIPVGLVIFVIVMYKAVQTGSAW